jgi:hypothetical protein
VSLSNTPKGSVLIALSARFRHLDTRRAHSQRSLPNPHIRATCISMQTHMLECEFVCESVILLKARACTHFHTHARHTQQTRSCMGAGYTNARTRTHECELRTQRHTRLCLHALFARTSTCIQASHTIRMPYAQELNASYAHVHICMHTHTHVFDCIRVRSSHTQTLTHSLSLSHTHMNACDMDANMCVHTRQTTVGTLPARVHKA